jgi:WXG100 family type VII secretion target
MPGFEVAYAAVVGAANHTALAADRLQLDLSRIAAEVESLLTGGWKGPAADAFRECWDDWVAGSRDVIEGLSAISSLLDATRLAYVEGDAASTSGLDAVIPRHL